MADTFSHHLQTPNSQTQQTSSRKPRGTSLNSWHEPSFAPRDELADFHMETGGNAACMSTGPKHICVLHWSHILKTFTCNHNRCCDRRSSWIGRLDREQRAFFQHLPLAGDISSDGPAVSRAAKAAERAGGHPSSG